MVNVWTLLLTVVTSNVLTFVTDAREVCGTYIPIYLFRQLFILGAPRLFHKQTFRFSCHDTWQARHEALVD